MDTTIGSGQKGRGYLRGSEPIRLHEDGFACLLDMPEQGLLRPATRAKIDFRRSVVKYNLGG